MHQFILKRSLSDAVYFSFLSFIVIGAGGFLYASLERTTGELEMGLTIVIMLSLMLILFFIAITNIVLSEPHTYTKKIRFWERIVGVFLFIFTSAVILGILGILFWWQV